MTVGKAKRVLDRGPRPEREGAPHVHASDRHSEQTAGRRSRKQPLTAQETGLSSRVRRQARTRRRHRGQGLDARSVSQDARPADLAARALRDRRHAAGRQLDHARAHAQAQGHLARQGAGRRRPRAVSVRSGGDAGRVARRAGRSAACRPREVFLDLQLSDAHLGGRRRDRLAGRRRGDHESDPAVPLLVRPLRARDGAHLQGGELPSAAGLRSAADHDAAERKRSARWCRTQSNRWWWPVADDVRPARQPVAAQRAECEVGHQAHLQRRAAAEVHRCHRAAGQGARRHRLPDPDLEAERGDAGTTSMARSIGTSSGTW